MAELDRITLTNPDGSEWTYRACHGSEFSPGETGWVLSMEGPGALAPQSISLTDMLGDFQAMGLGDDSAGQLAVVLTEAMVSSLQSGLVANRKYPNEPSADERLQQLEEELTAAGAALQTTETVDNGTQEEFVDRLVDDVRGWLGQGKRKPDAQS